MAKSGIDSDGKILTHQIGSMTPHWCNKQVNGGEEKAFPYSSMPHKKMQKE